MTSQDISLLFSVLHDGSVTAYAGNQRCLRLTIDCQYLAQRIDEQFDCFYLDLLDVAELTLKAWLDNEVTELWTDWHQIFAGELEFITAEAEDQAVRGWCRQDFATSGSHGGELRLCCAAAAVYDQAERPLAGAELRQLAADYWRDWTQQNQR